MRPAPPRTSTPPTTSPPCSSRSRNHRSEEELAMRVMVLIKADDAAEAGQLPDEQLINDMLKYNEDLTQAGVMLGGEGLHPTSRGAKVVWAGGKVTVVDGPFTEAKEIIAGYWLWQVRSMDEAIEWVKRMPASGGQDGSI